MTMSMSQATTSHQWSDVSSHSEADSDLSDTDASNSSSESLLTDSSSESFLTDSSSESFSTVSVGSTDSSLDLTSSTTTASSHQPGPQRTLSPVSKCIPLYGQSQVSVLESCLFVMQFALRFNLSGTATEHLLHFLRGHLPVPNHCVKSLYTLRKTIISNLPHYKPIRVSYCSLCSRLVDGQVTPCHDISLVKTFIMADVQSQLRAKFKDKQFWKYIKGRRSSSTDCISDIYDGKQYAQHTANGGFLDPGTNAANLSFLINTDGVAIFRSSKVSIWPVFLVINELPPNLRFSKRYMILCGIWFDKEKPSMYTLLKPILDQINVLYEQGMLVETEDGQFLSKCMILLCSVDLPARALVCNMKQFSGGHACCTCLDEGDNTLGSSPMHRVWPYTHNNSIRLEEDVRTAYRTATVNGCPELGYKGVPVLAIHPPFHLVKGMVTDYMHNVMLGVAKALMVFWFDPMYRGKPFSIIRQEKVCTDRLLKCKVPTIVRRLPRKIEERAQWKASEFQNWVLLYAIPVLEGILPEPYYGHFGKLICAISILLSCEIDRSLLTRAEMYLNDFCKGMEELYGALSQTMNVHLLRHLTFHVENFGPLWAYSCFPFEARNGDIGKFFHGTRNMCQQVIFSYVLTQSLNDLPAFQSMSPLAKATILKIGGSQEASIATPKARCIGDNLWQLGRSAHVEDTVLDLLPIDTATMVTAFKFFRLRKGSTVFSSLQQKSGSRNNHTVSFLKQGSICFGQIRCFVGVRQTTQFLVFAMVDKFDINETSFPAVKIKKVSSITPIVLPVPVDNILAQFVFMKLDSCQLYIATYPNKIVPLLDLF